MSTASPVTIVGATGLTGSASLKQLLASKTAFDITTIARKAINTPTAANPSTQYSHVLVDDLFEASKSDQIIAKAGSTYVSALGTTRGSAGSFEAQEKIDVTLNVDMAKRAKEQGAERVSLHVHSPRLFVRPPSLSLRSSVTDVRIGGGRCRIDAMT